MQLALCGGAAPDALLLRSAMQATPSLLLPVRCLRLCNAQPAALHTQVRFISHVLDKNAPLLGKLPDFAALARDLRSFVAANARHWEHRDDAKAGGGGARTASVTAGGGGGSLLTDTAVSGARDVVGKC